ncbi:MAG: NADH-quinone oxidoreductase subunit D [Calditrichaeota bacterium]|nr:MAG: NADH-quinone oxidoreductase subunit D [Calditrichota bacterium]
MVSCCYKKKSKKASRNIEPMTIQEQLLSRFGEEIQPEPSRVNEEVYLVPKNRIVEVCQYLKETTEPKFDFLMDLTAVDYLHAGKKPRFAVVYQLYSMSTHRRLRLKVPVPEADPLVPSVVSLWNVANWFEREVWDMFGIKFKNHPDLRRILMYDEFKGHPLRKDYPIDKRQPLVSNEKPYEDREILEYIHRIKEEKKNSRLESAESLREFVEKGQPLESDRTEHSFLMNMGPSHPAMHGVIHILLKLDGEYVEGAEIGIGYLHRAFEKEAEHVKWAQVFPYTDRLNYVSPLINNVAYAMAVEKLLDLEITERAKYIRVIMMEISRITDHLTAIAANAMELGAMTAFLYFIEAREELYRLVEEITGARLTVSYIRIGGVKADLTRDFPDRLRKTLKFVREKVKEVHKLLTRNRIFYDRMVGTGVISKEDALSYGFTGPVLRSTGVNFDVRKANPYLIYDQLDFDVPYGENGDNFDRYLCRMEEIEQSCRIIEQALDKIPGGPLNVDHEGKAIPANVMADYGKFGKTHGLLKMAAVTDPTLLGGNAEFHNVIFPDNKRVVLPSKETTYSSIEGVMNHFMLIMEGHGISPEPGEAYEAVEGANGELGFFVVSNGEDHAYRVRVRPPCFTLMSGFHKMIEGDQVADVIATFGTINMIAGELDR